MQFAAIIFFLVAMGACGVWYLFWRRHSKGGATGNNVAKVLPVAVADTVKTINALVITPSRYIFQHLTDDEIESVFTGWYTWQGNAIVICQRSPKTQKLEPWERQYHAIAEDLPSCTPQELGAITEWDPVVRPVYARKRGWLEQVNTMLMVGVFAGILLVGYLYFSSSTGA